MFQPTMSLLAVVLTACIATSVQAVPLSSKRYVPEFYPGVKVGTVTSHSVTEESGLCASRTHANVLYTHNDSGDSNRIFAIDATNGNLLAKIYIDGANSRDWEDIACGRCTGGSGNCIYIANTGGNTGHSENTIYRIREPDSVHHDQTVNLDSYLKFSWDQHDCETVMVDPTGEVYVVSKARHGHGKVVKLPSSAWGHSHRTYVSEGVYIPIYTPDYDPVGGDIALNGHEILLKTYRKIYYWYTPDGNLYDVMKNQPIEMPYVHERQGEAICFDAQGAGFYTIGENPNSPLYYYRLKKINYESGLVGLITARGQTFKSQSVLCIIHQSLIVYFPQIFCMVVAI